MNILICSHVFAPSIGGIETVTAVLAEQFSRMGATVTVVTQTPGSQASANYEVVRRPSVGKLIAIGSRAEIILQNQISLRTLLPLLLLRKPVFITYQGELSMADGNITWQQHIKRAAARISHNIAISRAIADSIPAKSVIIGNPFESGEFTADEATQHDKDIVFLGRLVNVKGCDILLRSLALLKQEGLRVSLTVIGDGPQTPELKHLAAELEIATQVDFRGAMREGRGRELARHTIMAIPSTWAEPFGVVALEGLAAGCVLVASNGGGLPEAVGPCGLLLPSGDAEAMAAALKRLLGDPALRKQLLAARKSHLEKFQPQNVARRYLEFFSSVLKSHPAGAAEERV